MYRARNGRADFVATGLANVITAMSYLLFVVVTAGRNDPGGTPVGAGTVWQAILAFGLMSAGLLMVTYGMRAPGARPPVLVRRAADAAGAALLHAGGPQRLMPVVILLVLSFLEAWFDFF
ncbi:hypothetical protein SETIT_7G239200v2 [Setaria italica]|uniref:Uncharacterized protein n=1 Tax=Setaria italica TaxID=4555 RepID=K3YEQ2_SETIT|nr:uncharacterized protein LOC105914857 [Setaria italica]RCV35430.1 hypothetical protein SETIT_7G239200v2 [Setaria italica]